MRRSCCSQSRRAARARDKCVAAHGKSGYWGNKINMSKLLCHYDIEKLISLWHTHPCLCDASSAAYSNVDTRQATTCCTHHCHRSCMFGQRHSAWRLTAGASALGVRQLIDSCISIIPPTTRVLLCFILFYCSWANAAIKKTERQNWPKLLQNSCASFVESKVTG